MAKYSGDKYFSVLPLDTFPFSQSSSPRFKVKKDLFDASNFVAKSPPKYRSRTTSKIESLNDDTQNGAFPIIKASEGPVIVTFGGIQLVSGILMIAFGILTMLHEASLSSVGAGLWGGAMGAASGFVGIIAGFKGCCQSSSDRISPLAITIYLALCLVAIVVSNLALVFTATGLLRDSHRVDYFLPADQDDYKYVRMDDFTRTNWAPVLTNVGLLIITAVECMGTIAAAFRCYWYVCRCRRRRRRRRRRHSLVDFPSDRSPPHPSHNYDSPEMTTASYCSSSRSKQKLIRCWLGQQSAVESTKSSKPSASPYGPVPPYYTIDGKTVYPSGSFVSYSDYNYMLPPNAMEPYYPQQCLRMPVFQHRSPQSRLQENDRRGESQFLRSATNNLPQKSNPYHKRSRKKSDSIITEEDIDKTYTGLDREIAEELISVTMETKRP